MGLKNAGKSKPVKSVKPGNLFSNRAYAFFILISCFSFFYNEIISYDIYHVYPFLKRISFPFIMKLSNTYAFIY